jgi:hypothetical protein
MLAPGLIADAARAPSRLRAGAEGLWRGNLVPTAKHLG